MFNHTNKKFEKIKRVAIYLRKSRKEEGQDDEEVFRNHRNALTKIANDNGWEYRIFEEVASSIKMDVRTELTRMLKEIESEYYQAVLVMDADRLSRSVKDSAIIKAILAEHEVVIVTADMQMIDLNEDNDSLVSDFLDVLSSFEYKQIRKRMLRGKKSGAYEGKYNNGVAPIGYKINNKKDLKLEIIEEEARIVRLIFKWMIEGKGSTTISDELNSMGLKTKNKRHFSDVAVRRIIKNETYKGTLIRHRIKWTGKKKEKHDKDNWVIVKNAFPPIVSEEEWDKANIELNNRTTEPSRTKVKTFGLSGLIKCGYCGYTLTMRNRKDRKTNKIIRGCHHKYPDGSICNNSGMPYYDCFEVIIKQLKMYEDKLEEKINNFKIKEDDVNKERELKLETLQSQIKKNEIAWNQNELAWEEAILTIPEYKEKRQKLSEKKEQLELELKDLQRKMNKSDTEETKELLDYLRKFLHDYDDMNESEINIALKSMINNVVIYNDKDKDDQTIIKLNLIQ